MDLNYTRDTTSGQERACRRFQKFREIDNTLPICCDDCLGDNRTGRRRNENMARRDFVTKTVGQPATCLTIVRDTDRSSRPRLRRERQTRSGKNQMLRGTMPDLNRAIPPQCDLSSKNDFTRRAV